MKIKGFVGDMVKRGLINLFTSFGISSKTGKIPPTFFDFTFLEGCRKKLRRQFAYRTTRPTGGTGVIQGRYGGVTPVTLPRSLFHPQTQFNGG